MKENTKALLQKLEEAEIDIAYIIYQGLTKDIQLMEQNRERTIYPDPQREQAKLHAIECGIKRIRPLQYEAMDIWFESAKTYQMEAADGEGQAINTEKAEK